MAFEGLADRLQGTIQKIRGKGKVNESDEIGRASCRERVSEAV